MLPRLLLRPGSGVDRVRHEPLSRRPRRSFRTPIAVVVIALLFGIQCWATLSSAHQAEQDATRVIRELTRAPANTLTDEKSRQEAISLRIQNATRAFFWNGILGGLGPMITTTVALIGMWLGLLNYLDTRDKERLDRAAVDLKDVLERVVSDSPRERAVGVVGLQHFLSEDKQEYHLRVLSALLAMARMEKDGEVSRGIRMAVEQAVQQLSAATLSQPSWQSVKLQYLNLAGRSLAGLDLRDAKLDDADLSRCDLSQAMLMNASLKGARLDHANLRGANLTYADLAGASLADADLTGATLAHAKVLQMSLTRATLVGTKLDTDSIPWELIRDWRDATFDPGVREQLIAQYGPARRGPRVLMLMWEIPPLVAGGTWTACYHLVRSLRTRGADVAVVVPWDDASILPNPFGAEAEVIPLGMKPPQEEGTSPYSGTGTFYGSYGTSSYGVPSWSPYSWLSPTPAPSWTSYSTPYGGWGSPYASSAYGSQTSPYLSSYSATASDRDRALQAGSTLLRLADEYTRRVLRLVEEERFDIIHAHDWVTFDAARAASLHTGKPWVAHVHSTEFERRPEAPDHLVAYIEREGLKAAHHVVAPSRVTASLITKRYEIPEARVSIIPNPLSRDQISPLDMGRFENRRVVFLGRLARQKGPDLFAEIARQVRREHPDIHFWMYGSGESPSALDMSLEAVEMRGGLSWNDRGRAFRGASAVIVPSRAEPFGMVILEAMQHRVPVLYTGTAGAAEVLSSGVPINIKEISGASWWLTNTLRNLMEWEGIVRKQSEEIAEYVNRDYPDRMMALWQSLESPKPAPQGVLVI